MCHTKNYMIIWAFEPWWLFIFPFGKDEDSGKWAFMKPEFRFEVLKGKPCPTRWIYDWILDFGWLSIYKKNVDIIS